MRTQKYWIILALSLLIVTPDKTSGENILFFFGISTYSHRIPVWPLVEKLVEKGHNVTFVSPFSPKVPNPKVHEFTPKEITLSMEKNTEGPVALHLRSTVKDQSIKSWFGLPNWGLGLCELFLKSPDVRHWISSSKFDLVVIDGLFNDCGLGLAYKFNAPHLIYDTTSIFMWQLEAFGIPNENSWIPDMQYFFPQKMSFLQRLWTTGNSLRCEEFPRSLPPYVIPVGGMHIKENVDPLPKTLENFINGSEKGFVYISFGSSVQISKAPPEIYGAFIEAIKRIKVNFIWKWEGDNLPSNLPSNVFMQKWMPQQALLAHPKIKAFVTHSGLMSIQEAIFNGVPLVSLPVFSEQDYNAERVHTGGYGIRLEITTLTADQLVEALSKILYTPSYKDEMLKKSKAFRDRPMSPADTALWWTEFVLRQGDTSFLKPMSIYQKLLTIQGMG
ncbi:unnamed protein product [Allacma fusca]|uniref:UDP-glucuronosyltransferase n=1 Tax=Allacma fusca TaxID=39272 RepID=A0A8J2JSA4_9HEXA|nr:unnamed protein product [Allacma fusca]